MAENGHILSSSTRIKKLQAIQGLVFIAKD